MHPEKTSITGLTLVAEDESSISFTSSFYLTPSRPSLHSVRIPCQFLYTVQANGQITLETNVELPNNMPPPPRLGLRTALSSSLSQVNWFGFGPHEAYDDRKSCVTLGLFSNQVDDLHVPYVVPQESGHRYDPRWIEFFELESEKIGFQIVFDQSLSSTPSCSNHLSWGWSASRYSLETLESTKHNHELEVDPNHQIHLHLDRVMMGLGGYDSWSPNVDSKYLISSGKWKFHLTLIPKSN